MHDEFAGLRAAARTCLFPYGLSLLAAVVPLQAAPAQAGTAAVQSDDSPSARLCNGNVGTSGDQFDARRLSSTIAIHNCWKADVDNDSAYFLNDLYTRWVVEQLPQPDLKLERDYRSERISPIARLFVGKTRGAVMTAKITMRDPDIAFTIPLIALDYSGKLNEGQTFATAFTSSDMGLPDFRLSPNTSASVEATARITEDVNVQSTGIVLSALKDTLALAAPGGSLLTSVNREQVQRLSTAYDTALSRLLSSSIDESATVGRLTSEWYEKSSILIGVDIPDDFRTRNWTKASPTPRRLWYRLSMACPRVSIFDNANVCSDTLLPIIRNPYRNGFTGKGSIKAFPGADNEAYRTFVSNLGYRISPNQVLGFRVGPARSIRQFLTEQEWFITLSKKIVFPTGLVQKAVDNLEANKPTVNPEEMSKAAATAGEFCDAVVDKLYVAGLSRLDAQIGLWAVASGMPDFAASRQIFQESQGCKANLPGDGSGVWQFAPRTTKTPKS